jgi:hypothetical protein
MSKNTRFDILIEDTNNSGQKNKEDKAFKKNKSKIQNNNYEEISVEERIKKEEITKLKKEEDIKIKEQVIQNALNVLNVSNFPELSSYVNINDNINDIEQSTCTTFLDKLKFQEEKNDKPQIDDTILSEKYYRDLEPGWTYILSDIKTREKIIRYKPSYDNVFEHNEQAINNKVLNGLVNLHNKKTQEYIEKWGYDEWEHMHRFTNYDYEYFDKLDQLDEDELEQIDALEEIEENSELIDDYYFRNKDI